MCTRRMARPESPIACKQPRDEIAMHGVGVAAGAILQHAEAIDDDIDGVLAQQAASAAASIDITGNSRSSGPSSATADRLRATPTT